MAMTESATIAIEVAYALPARQSLLWRGVAVGTPATAAALLSGMATLYPDLDLETAKLGIFSKLVQPDTVLREHDRVEIYRPLQADPKEVRRRRAAEGKGLRKGEA